MRRAVLFPFLLAGLLAPGLRAQTNDDINSGLQFNFSTPGARSLAMGGAFLALADDATAAYTNPAGLTSLTVGGSEVSLEMRQWRYSNIFTDGGHAFGEPSGIGVDTVAGLQQGVADSEVSGLSFLSLGYVLPRGWTVALYRHELAHFEARIESQGPVLGASSRRPNGERRLTRVLPARSSLDLQIVNYGLSGAREIGPVSLGAGVSFYQLEMASRTERFDRGDQDFDGDGDVDADDEAANRQPGRYYGPADFLGDNLFNTQTQRGDDDALGVNLGVLWKIGPRWSVGAAYRQGPGFDVEARYVYGPKGQAPGQSANPNLCSATRIRNCLGGSGVLNVPDVLGAGVAWSTAEGRTKITLDYDRVQYSQLTEDILNILTREMDSFDRSQYRVEDGDEIHLGFENVLGIGTQFVATLRLGAWFDPAHTVEYLGRDESLRARFLKGEDEIHASAGLGVVIKENLQIDVALDLSDRAKTGSLSLVKFF